VSEARPRRRARKPKTTERAGPAFWGQAPARPDTDGDEDAPPAPEKVRLTGDPSALLRSLGEPPLGRNPAAALHHLSIVYEEAVRTATALAAANGLLDMDDAED
jgi:hypothetical protein